MTLFVKILIVVNWIVPLIVFGQTWWYSRNVTEAFAEGLLALMITLGLSVIVVGALVSLSLLFS